MNPPGNATSPGNTPLRLYLIAGERSGDTHAAALMRALLMRRSASRFSGVGGPRMAAIAPGTVEDWCEQAAVVGLSEVLRKYGYFRRRFRAILDVILETRPDAVVPVDYPGFNLRLATALRRRGYGGRLLYYISPQVWAWNPGRIDAMARVLDAVLCLFPFEVDPYRRAGLDARFVGHPMVDALGCSTAGIGQLRDANLVGLFPGSRWREIKRIFPAMLGAARRVARFRPGTRFEVAAASAPMAEAMRRMIRPADPLVVGCDNAHSLMRRAAFGLVASGTATLEAAFLGLPMALVYRVAPLTYEVGRRLIRVPNLGMVNLLAGEPVVPELIQRDANARALADEVLRMLEDDQARCAMTERYRRVIPLLGAPGASGRAADAILELCGAAGRPKA